jgi:hypothetical protein
MFIKRFCKITGLLYFFIIPFIFTQNTECTEKKYPQDALRNTMGTVEFSHNELKKIRCAVGSIIDTNEQEIPIAVNLANKKVASLLLDDRLPKNKELEALLDNLHHCTELYNRISKALTKDKDESSCSFSYTLFESDHLFQNIPGLARVCALNQTLITKIKNNTVTIKESVNQKIINELACCLCSIKFDGYAIPNEIANKIIKYDYIIINQPQQYRAGQSNDGLFYPQDSFDGLSPWILTETQIPVLAPVVKTSDRVYPTKQVWFNTIGDSELFKGIRLSDDYTPIDIYCKIPKSKTLVATEFCNKFLIALYNTSNGKNNLAVFDLPMVKRTYWAVHLSRWNAIESIKLAHRANRSASSVFSILASNNKDSHDDTDIHFVGIDKLNECFLYEINKKLWRSPLQCNKPQEIILNEVIEAINRNEDQNKDLRSGLIDNNKSELFTNTLFKKMVSPTRFISFFLTQQGDIWVLLYKSTIRKNVTSAHKIFNYEWFKFNQNNYVVDDIAIERWPLHGAFGLAIMTKDKKLLCEQFPDDIDSFLKLCQSFEAQSLYVLKPRDIHKRLYIYNKKVIELYTDDENTQDWFLEIPIAWN